MAGSKTLSLRWTDSLCATPRQGFFCRVWDLCVAFHQSWGFRAHRNQSKLPDVHRFTDTQETWFFRPKLCFSDFFPLDFSVRRNNTTVVNYLWGLGFRFFFLFTSNSLVKKDHVVSIVKLKFILSIVFIPT